MQRRSGGGLRGRARGGRHDVQLLAVLDPLRRARAVELQVDVYDAYPRRPVIEQDRVRPRAVEPAADDVVLKDGLRGARVRRRVERGAVPALSEWGGRRRCEGIRHRLPDRRAVADV